MRISDWSSDVCSSDLLDKIHPDRIRIVASSFLVALAACFESDLILTAPARVIGRLAEVYGLRAVRPPILMEAFEVRQYWHARNQDDPPQDRKSVVSGKSVSVRVDLGCRRIVQQKINNQKEKLHTLPIFI